MKIHNVLQRSEAWENLRRGIPTASQFGRILTPAKLQLSASAKDYACELVAQRLRVESPPRLPTFDMDRGTELEPYAFAEFAESHSDCTQVGFITDDDETYGCSPDGLVGNDELLEIKCPKVETLIAWHNNGVLPSEYRMQVQGQMWVTGRRFCHFLAWHPEIEPLNIFVRCEYDFFRALDATMPLFLEMVAEIESKVRKRAVPYQIPVDAELTGFDDDNEQW